MEVDSPEYPGLFDDILQDSSPLPENDILIKQTLLHSPIFTNIIPDFKICINKKIAGLPSSSINDEADQTLLPPEEDSQFDAFDDDDDELLMDTDRKDTPEADHASGKNAEPKQEIVSVRVIVKTTSIVVDEVEFALNSTVRSSCVLRGIRYGKVETHEDSLFLSISSGYMFLIRLFRVPRGYTMDKHDTGSPIDPESSFVIKPYVVQWWDTNSSSPLSLSSSGHNLHAHSSGLCVVSTSASDAFRIYNCQQTEAGLMCLPHLNVPVNGVIVSSCFAEPMNKSIMDNHMSFLTLQFSESRRLEAHLHSWSWSESIEETFEKCMLPLPNDFPVPIFIVPLAHNSSFLFVSQSLLTIVTIHQILSAEFSFNHFPFNGSFTTNYFVSDDFDVRDEKTDCVLLSTDDGTIYSVLVSDNSKVTVTPIIRVSDPISIFTLEKTNNHYRLIFGSDTGSNRELIIPDLFDKEYSSSLGPNQKPKYSTGSLVTDFKSWSPVLDIQIIDSFKSRSITSPSNQELWALTGSGRRTRLTQLKKGHNAYRKSKTYEKLRKSNRLWFHTLSNRHFLFCRLPFETAVLEYQPGVEDCLYEIEDPKIITDGYTLLFVRVDGNAVLQVTRNSVVLSDLFELTPLKLEFSNIISADSSYEYIALVLDEGGMCEIRLLEIDTTNGENTTSGSELITMVAKTTVEYQASFIKLIKFDDTLFLLCGDYRGNLIVSKLAEGVIVTHSILPFSSFIPCMDNPNFDLQNMIVHDVIYSSKENNLFIGSKDGFYMHLKLEDDFDLKCQKFLKLGSTPVSLHMDPTDENFLLVSARSLWVVDLYESAYPSKVYLEEKTDRAIMCAAPFVTESSIRNHIPFAFVRDEGLTIGAVALHRGAVVKQMNIMEPARRLLYLPYLSCFVVLCNTKGVKQKLKFIDRKTFKAIPHKESVSKAESGKESIGLFKENEVPISACIWSIRRGEKISKKLLIGSHVGSNKGTFRILNVSKLPSQDGQSIYLHVSEASSFDHNEPISNIQQIGGVIFFSSDNTIYSTALISDERRLKLVENRESLASTIVSMTVTDGNTLLVTTKSNSIFVFQYNEDADELTLISRDLREKSLVNQAKIGSEVIASDKLHSSISFMNTNDGRLLEHSTIQLSSIARVYASEFYSSWVEGDIENHKEGQPGLHVCCVGVNGEVVTIKACSSKGREIQSLVNRLGLDGGYTHLKAYIERLDRPFADKVNGKGFRPIHRPHFDFSSNKGKVVDCDLEELARVRNEDICI